MLQSERYNLYLKTLKTDFTKICKLEFLQPDGSVAFSLDNNAENPRSKTFIQDGTLTCNLQNGPRRWGTVKLSNLNGEYDYNVNTIWFGQQIRLSEGLILPNGEEFYLPQGIFYIKEPQELLRSNERTASYNLVDKWSYLDGSLFGNLDGVYVVPRDSNIFDAVSSILTFPRGNGYNIDDMRPIFTTFYNGLVTELPDGTTISNILTPYELRCEGTDGTYAQVILALNDMLVGWIGYDQTGRLRLDPSQDDILDTDKPVMWDFTPTEKQLISSTYVVKDSEMYNDVIVEGESLGDYKIPAARATNLDPSSNTNVNIVGWKTIRLSASGYFTEDICQSLALFKLKRMTVMQKGVTIESTQMFHLTENNLVTIRRHDKKGSPIERHIVTGFTRPFAQKGTMSIQATAVQDFPTATITKLPWQ